MKVIDIHVLLLVDTCEQCLTPEYSVSQLSTVSHN